MCVLTLDGVESKGTEERGTAIPYYAWNNRGTAPVAVWLAQGP
jgi:DUF1680 family protein